MKTVRGISRLIGAFVGLAMMVMAGTASSAIIVDPGEVGSTFELSPVFTVEPGDIENNSFGIVWSDMKHVKLFAGTSYEVGLVGGSAFTGGFSFTGFLTDENGDEIPNTVLDGTVFDDAADGTILEFDQDLVFHDAHFLFDSLPMAPFVLNFFVFPADEGESAVVGEWTAEVPEPSTLALFAIALGGLGFMTRRRVA